MNWIMYFIMFILGAISMFMMVCIGYAAKQEEPINRVHFYVEMNGRDKELKLYIQTVHGYKLMIAGQSEFKWFGLNPQDFDFIEGYNPVEVFLNLEDRVMAEKEKAKDKKIREAILNGLIDCRDAPDLGWSNFGGIHIDDCTAWLEKQRDKDKLIQEAEFALENQWINVNNDLPCNHMELMHPMYYLETQHVVTNIQGHYYINRMLKYKGKWVWETGKPTHWLPIPEPPKE